MVVVMVLSRSRQGSEERDFGTNGLMGGTQSALATVKSSARQIRAKLEAYQLRLLLSVGSHGGWGCWAERGGALRSWKKPELSCCT